MQKTRYVLDGIVPILQTPFAADGSLDLASLQRLADHVIRAGAVGAVYPAVASEAAKLSGEERRLGLEVVLAQAAGRVPIFAGVSASHVEESLALSRDAQEQGAAGILVQAPPSAAGDASRLREFFRRLAGGADLPLMIQDLDWHGGGMPLELIQELFEELPSFRCIKVETVPAGPKYSRILAITEGRLHVSGGWAITQMLDGLERGVHAFMPEGSMVAIYRAIVARFASGDREGARQLFESLLPVLAFSNQHIDVSVQFFKRVLVAKGVFRAAVVRTPITALDAMQERTAATLVDRVLSLEASLGSKFPTKRGTAAEWDLPQNGR
ncbi:MAG: dihydrodipicolinate synthase family protein [Zetaproteobacteria bacterium]|nr:MAG: dihydrodipicolinate synthase family protein [Zetaproteobacteria bacterium]